MKKLALLTLGLLVIAGAGPAQATHPTGATQQDLQRLQDALENLDDSVAALETSHPRSREFQDRADEIRDEVVYLKVQMRRHQRNRRTGLGASKAEVDDLRRSIADLQSDIDTALNRRFTGSGVLPEGAEIQVRLEQPLSSKTARREDRFEATVATPVQLDGRVVIPAGTRLRGIVMEAQPAERPARGGRLDLTFDSIYLDDRTRTDLRTRVVSIKENMDRSESAQRASIGAVLGSVLGSLIGGKKGALIGLVIGGTGGVVATAGEEVDLPTGSILTLRLERALDVRR